LHIPTYLLPGWFVIAATGCALAALLTALRSAHWQALLDEPGRMHLVAGGAVACLLLWLHEHPPRRRAADLHFLGVTTLTLVVGWSFTCSPAAALVGFFLLQGLEWGVCPCRCCCRCWCRPR
jgi:uncharacterized membrane protein